MPRNPTSAVSYTTPKTFTDTLPLPTVIVFDLDYTLWPFWIDTHVSPPLKPLSTNSPSYRLSMQDRYGEKFGFYPEVPGILYEAKRKGMFLGLASRTHTPDLANILLRGLDVRVPPNRLKKMQDGETSGEEGGEKEDTRKAIDFFSFREIYPGSKVRHLKSIQASTKAMAKGDRKWGKGGVPFEDMLFFDDESRNRDVERELGVPFCLVRDGVTSEEVDRGVWEWRKRRGITKKDGVLQNSESSSGSVSAGDVGNFGDFEE